MGLEDRDYYQEDENSWRIGFGSSGFRNSDVPGLGGFSAVALIIMINVALFFLDAFSPQLGEGVHWLSTELALHTKTPWKFWTFLTSGFAHSSIDSKIGIWHIAGNMIVLYFFGTAVEARLGKLEFVKFYLLSIVFSSLCFFLFRTLTNTPAICLGASGACSAVLIQFIIWYPKKTILLMFVIPAPAWVLGVFLIGSDILRAFNPETRIAWEAHLGGAGFAALYYSLAWNFQWLRADRIPWIGNRSQVKLFRPNERDMKLEEEADKVLAKVAEHGEESLTHRERKVLHRYSKLVKKKQNS